MKEMEKVGILLSSGYTKKEIANTLHKSIHTVNQQARVLYSRTHSRNLADITRWMIRRYTGVSVDNILVNALHDITVLGAIVLFVYIVLQPGFFDELKAEIINRFFK